MNDMKEKILDGFHKIAEAKLRTGKFYQSVAYMKSMKLIKSASSWEYDNTLNRVVLLIGNEKKFLGEASTKIFLDIFTNGESSKVDREVEDSNKIAYTESDLYKISGLGYNRVNKLVTSGIKSIQDLIKSKPKLGKFIGKSGVRFTDQIANGLESVLRSSDGLNRSAVIGIVNSIKKRILKETSITSIEFLGSYRRKREVINNLDVSIFYSNTNEMVGAKEFILNSLFDPIYSSGDNKISGMIDGIQVDVRFLPLKYRGAYMLYGTGSVSFNVMMRKTALERGYSLSEYGMTNLETNEVIYFDNEADIFKFLDVPYFDPKDR